MPMVDPLKRILREEWMRVGRPATGPVVTRSVGSGKWQARADKAWEAAGLARVHEARHTYASFLMAAGYKLKQIQEYLGHADLVTTGRYVKNLPVPRGTTAREKLGAYLAAELGDIDSKNVDRNVDRNVGAVAVRGGSSGTDASGRDGSKSGELQGLPGGAECRRRDSNPRHADYDSACPAPESAVNTGLSATDRRNMDTNMDTRVIAAYLPPHRIPAKSAMSVTAASEVG